MKKLFFILFFFYSLNAFAQPRRKIDSVYYLIDTAKIPANARLWDIHEEYPSFKVYIIQCPCLQFDKQPSLIYDTKTDSGKFINDTELKSVKLVSLATLILKAKQFTKNGFKGDYAIFLVEPIGEKYVFHKVRLLNPTKPRGSSIDYENIPPVDSTKKPL